MTTTIDRELHSGEVVFNNQGIVAYASNELCLLLGFDRNNLVGKDLGDILSPEAQKVYRENLLPVLRIGFGVHDLCLPIIDKNGNEIPMLLSCHRRKYRQGLRNIGTFTQVVVEGRFEKKLFKAHQDLIVLQMENQILRANVGIAYSALITQSKAWMKFKESVSTIAYQDELTGLVNRRGFEMRFEEEATAFRASKIPFSLLMIDIDHFKEVNDAHGHSRGDAVLRLIAAVLQRTVRKLDFVARWGGDELVVLLPETGKDASIMAAERIRLAVQSEKLENESITVSAGSATYDDASVSCTSIMASADRALYAAKNSGRNRVVHASDIDASLDRRKDVDHVFR